MEYQSLKKRKIQMINFNIKTQKLTFKLTNKSNGDLAKDLEELIKKEGLTPHQRPNNKNKR